MRIKARRMGNAGVLSFNLPAAMSRALPEGGLIFEAEFTDDGIHLTFIGLADPSETHRRVITATPPKWASQ